MDTRLLHTVLSQHYKVAFKHRAEKRALGLSGSFWVLQIGDSFKRNGPFLITIQFNFSYTEQGDNFRAS